MKLIAALSLAVALCAVTVRAAPAEGADPAEDLVHLTNANFDEEIAKHDVAGVFFYAPWCGHCKNAKPEWAKAGDLLKEDGIPMFAVNADEDENRPLAQRFGVQGFPTISIFRKSDIENPIPYNGARTAEAFADGVRVFSGPAATQLDQADDSLIHDKDIEHTKVTVVAFLEKLGGEEQKAFEAAADKIRQDGHYYFTDNLEIAKVIHQDLEVKANTLLVYRHYDGEYKRSEAIGSEDDIVKFINANYVAPFLDFSAMSGSIAERVYRGDHTFNVFVYGDESKKDEIKEWAAKIPEKFAGDLAPAVIFDVKGDQSRIAGYFGFSNDLDVSLAVTNLNKDKHNFVMDESATEESAFQYIEDVVAGKIKRSIKSEEVPATNSEPVKVVVGKNFNDLVLSGKNVLLEIYAPWCGHCKSLAPIYEELAKDMESDAGIVIAKIDGTANDVPDERFSFTGFPTLHFIDSEGKVQKYEGPREKEAIKSFLEENKTPVEGASAGEGEEKEL